ncbi:MAG TPA: Zn-dependent alcohol dehydrogenase [Acidimicrobiales bacterium]|jgi:S-(hydroxymethyl)glutathione dehydrogenase/alcohol dehydrogenase|nr:Zn-dependent alcohol dehydrogenase [Acidimicrobiales bacterium]
MRAALLRSVPGWLEIADIDVASPGPHDVLVQTVAAGLCHSDLHVIEGSLPLPPPLVLGHESAGIVEAVGSDVTAVQPGDRVIACTSMACGMCRACATGHAYLCTARPVRNPQLGPALSENGDEVFQFADIGGFAEQMLLPDKMLVKIDADIALDRAALIGCAATTGLGAVFNTAKVPPGAVVAVIGCGGIGLNVVQGAIVAGAARVIAIDVAQPNLELAKQFGATDVVDATQGDPVMQVMELTSGGVDYSFEALGRKETIEQSFNMLASAGTATVIGVSSMETMVELPAITFMMERRIQGCMMGSNRFQVDIPYYIDLYLQGRIKLDELIGDRIVLDQVNDGYKAMQSGTKARSVILFD